MSLPAAESFSDYGFTKGYANTWIRPSQEEWTVNNLSKRRDTFAPTDSIAFACESISDLKDSDDTVSILVVVRNEEGNVVDHYSGQNVWNEMWTRNKYVGELTRTPQEAGTYTLEIYFNGKLVNTGTPVEFTITEAE